MREESHLDEMREAIRGDFERLAERRGDQGLLRVTELEEDAVHEEPDPVCERDPAPQPEQEAEPEPDEAERKSWLARLFAT